MGNLLDHVFRTHDNDAILFDDGEEVGKDEPFLVRTSSMDSVLTLSEELPTALDTEDDGSLPSLFDI